MKRCFLLILAALCACGPSSVEEYRAEGEAITRRMIRCLRQVDSLEEARARQKEFETLYLEYAELLVEADRFLKKGDVKRFPEIERGAQLRQELLRVYQIDGVRDILEQAQKEGVYHLNRFVGLDDQ